MSNLIPDPEAKYQLFDRIVNVRQGFTVPFGLRGTVVGIHPGEKEYETIYDVVFDEKFPNGIDLGYVFFYVVSKFNSDDIFKNNQICIYLAPKG